MKLLGSFLVLLVSVLIAGCYTQLAITDDEPETVPVPQATEIVEPPPVVVVMEPILEIPPPPYFPPPAVVVPAPAPVAQPQPEASRREIGNHRSGSSESKSGSSDARTSGSTRNGR
jgi:ABC-type Fe3+-hydroxamate transport system substrate-binding protein